MLNYFKERIKKLCPNIPDVLLDIATRDNINNNQEVQKNKFAALRAIAIWYLEHGNGTVVRGFRGEYCFTNPDKKSFNGFLQYQKHDKTWMTDIELTALGELFGFSIVITDSKDKQKDRIYPLYNAGDQAPVLNFYNRNDTHWKYINFSGEIVKTVTDGNCGYHAFELGLQEVITQIDVLEKIETRAKAQQDEVFHETRQSSIDIKQVASSSDTTQNTVEQAPTRKNVDEMKCSASKVTQENPVLLKEAQTLKTQSQKNDGLPSNNSSTKQTIKSTESKPESKSEPKNEQKPVHDQQQIQHSNIDQAIISQQRILKQVAKQLPDPQELRNIQ